MRKNIKNLDKGINRVTNYIIIMNNQTFNFLLIAYDKDGHLLTRKLCTDGEDLEREIAHTKQVWAAHKIECYKINLFSTIEAF